MNYINKIICGDCLNIIKQLPSNFIDLIIADPPYLTTNEKWDKKEIFSDEIIKELFRVAKDNCSIYIWCGIGEKSQSLIRWFHLLKKYFYFKDLITWKKQRGIGMKRGWLYTREEIMWFVKDNKKFIWNKKEQYSEEKRPWNVYKKGGEMVNKSEFKRYTNVWTDIIEDGYGSCPKKYSEKRFHFTPKPVKAMERIIKLHTKENDVVLDSFLGSGTTAVACKKLNRKFIGIELDKEHCKIAKQRINNI